MNEPPNRITTPNLDGVRLDLALARRHRAQAGCDVILIATNALRLRVVEGETDFADQVRALRTLVDRLETTLAGGR